MIAGVESEDARVLSALDLTRLADDDAPAVIRTLCGSAAAAAIRPAAVCVFASYAAVARTALAELGAAGIEVACVANFPRGDGDPESVLEEIRVALAAGAGEIDLVYPWRAHDAGERGSAATLVRRCKEACGARPLKAIIETGEQEGVARIRELALAAIDAGADFVKTSTGTTRVGATPEAARVILECLRERGRGGLKASGGIRTLGQARAYLELADGICGSGWATPLRFRIGTSTLLGGMRASERSSDQ